VQVRRGLKRYRTLRARTGLRRPAFALTGLRRGHHRIALLAPRGVRLDAVAVSR
jgi:hypothetical protein